MEILLQTLTELTGLPRERIFPVLGLFKVEDFRARVPLLKPGKVSDMIWFVGSRMLRAYYYVEERKRSGEREVDEKIHREVTNWIVLERGMLTDVPSFLNQTPSDNYIETLEASKLYGLSYINYQKIIQHYGILTQTLFEHHLTMAEKRIQICNLRNPEDRYALFQQSYPGWAGRLSVKVQASYLTIDPITLSKLRRKARYETLN
jgi:CRP-like cAMP-binding protein